MSHNRLTNPRFIQIITRNAKNAGKPFFTVTLAIIKHLRHVLAFKLRYYHVLLTFYTSLFRAVFRTPRNKRSGGHSLTFFLTIEVMVCFADQTRPELVNHLTFIWLFEKALSIVEVIEGEVVAEYTDIVWSTFKTPIQTLEMHFVYQW